LKFLLRLIALPVLILFVLALPLSLVLRNMGALIFDADTTKALVRESLLDSELAGSLARQGAESLLTRVDEEGGEAGQKLSLDAFAQLSEEDWRQITEIVAPETLVADTVDGVIDAFSDWLNDAQAEFPNLSVDLSEWKIKTVENADRLVTVFMDSLPECSQAAMGELAQQSLIMQVESLPACRPSEPLYSQLVSQSATMIERMLDGAPDAIDLDQITQGADAPRELIEL